MARVLVIDPDLEVLEIMKVLLTEEGFSVATAVDLAEAEGIPREGGIDLILTEVFEQEDYLAFDPRFLEGIRKTFPDTAIMLFSVFPSVDQVRPEKYGLAGVVAKPFDIDNLLAKIEKALKNGSGSVAKV